MAASTLPRQLPGARYSPGVMTAPSTPLTGTPESSLGPSKRRGPIYGSPAVAEVPGTPLTVYIGSYDSRLYALDAASGKKLWDYDVGGPVPGTATVIGHTVYTSSFKTVESVGIDVLSHRKTFSFDSPGYTPMISDGRNLFLIGYFTVHGFRPG